MSNRIILGLAGAPGTGKSTIAEHLYTQHGFIIFEGSEHLKSAAKQENKALKSRSDYDTFHREKQQAHGLTWLADTALSIDTERLVFSGLRTRPNANKLRTAGGFVIGLQCPPDVCLQRMDLTNPKNAQTVEEYVQQLTSQESPTEEGAHALWVADTADFKIDTSVSLETSLASVDTIVQRLAHK